MTYRVWLRDPSGVAESVEVFLTSREAGDAADWLNDNRDPAQMLDGTTYTVEPEPPVYTWRCGCTYDYTTERTTPFCEAHQL